MIAIPPNVVEAAHLLENFFAKEGVEDWVLMGVCSRKMYDKLKKSALVVTSEKTIQHVSGKT